MAYTRLVTANRSRVSIRPCKRFSSHLVWSPCKIWLLFLILCAHNVGGPKFLGRFGAAPWDGGTNDSLETCFSPSVLPRQIWSILRSNHTRIITEIRQKNLPLRFPPFKVTRGHWNWHGSISYLRLPFSDP